MKILGKGNRDDFIVQMTGDEFANLAGKHSDFYLEKHEKPAPGVEIPVSDMYQRADRIINLHQELSDNLEKLKEHHDTFCALIKSAEEKADAQD